VTCDCFLAVAGSTIAAPSARLRTAADVATVPTEEDITPLLRLGCDVRHPIGTELGTGLDS